MNPRRNPIIIFLCLLLAGFVLTVMAIRAGGDEHEPFIGGGEELAADTQIHRNQGLLADGLLVYGPDAVGFDVHAFVTEQGGHLAGIAEDINGQWMDGAAIITKVSQEYSVSPKLLLAIIEHQSGWVSHGEGDTETGSYPVDGSGVLGEGLFVQLSRTADLLNFGFYACKVGALDRVSLTDGVEIDLPDDYNCGSAGVYHFFASISRQEAWNAAITNGGLMKHYEGLFGPIANLTTVWDSEVPVQPSLHLPFEVNKPWAFTGGPHSAWGRYAAWAALDFAPPKDRLGCVPNDEWVTAVSDGEIVRSEPGTVILDLDGDGLEQTGWVIVYFHMETRDRIGAGVTVNSGDRLGHASCEGGISTGTHLHIARKYNGEWVPADQENPFVLDGWVSRGTGIEYNGTLHKQEEVIEALDGRQEKNIITR
ncbi:MAG: peptidoglycan DD-metalloendopeptidase family protein [Anaerolineae bacterium]|nr:peptidoglycan DD-metalloendopeptidase family protein [Anaerolineae bacterium]